MTESETETKLEKNSRLLFHFHKSINIEAAELHIITIKEYFEWKNFTFDNLDIWGDQLKYAAHIFLVFVFFCCKKETLSKTFWENSHMNSLQSNFS